MSYISGIKAYKIFNLSYLTKKNIVVKNYFYRIIFIKFLNLNYLSPFIVNVIDKGLNRRVRSFFFQIEEGNL
jgi:hypothetical protein